MNRDDAISSRSALLRKRLLYSSRISRQTLIKELKSRNSVFKERQIPLAKPIRLGDIEVRIVDLDEEKEGKKSRKFVFTSEGKPTVTIVDEEPDNLDTEGTVQVLDRTFPIRITHKQINDAYKAAYLKVISERLKNNIL